jgi:hypothetical protein
MSKKSVIRKPYPLELQFTEQEQRFYDNDKAYIDNTAKELNNPKQGEVIIIRDPMRKSVSYKKANQLSWDKGIGRPYSYNEDLILEKMSKIKEKIKAEENEVKKQQDLRVLNTLHSKIPEAKELDKVEGEKNKQETEGMEQAETETRDFLRDERRKKERDAELERMRQRELIEAPKREARRRENEAREKEREMMTEEDKPALQRKAREASVRQNETLYQGILENANKINYKMVNEYNFSIYEYLVGLTSSLLESLKQGVLIGDIEFIEELVDLVNRLPKSKSNVPTEVRDLLEEKIPELEPKVKELKPIVKDLLHSRENGVLRDLEVNTRLKHPLYRAISRVDTDIYKYIEKVKDIKRWKKEREEEAKRKPKMDREKVLKKLEKLKKEYNKLKEEGGDENKLKELKKKYNQLKEDYNSSIKEGTGIIDNPELYEEAVAYADNIFKKPSAFKSGFIVKKYKELGGTYSGEKPNKTGIARWFKEEWKDIGNQEYPVFRPTKRITKDTPLTPEEIKPANLKKQIALKQEIKGDANLPPFEEKTGGKVVALGVQAEKIPKQDEIWKWSNPEKVADNARKYLGDMAVVFRSTKPKKKYMIFDPVNKKWVFFGEINYEDFTKHQDPKRRENYLTRTASMKGNWKNNKYSANNLSRNILW